MLLFFNADLTCFLLKTNTRIRRYKKSIFVVIFLCGYAQSCAFISVIELPRIPAYFPKYIEVWGKFLPCGGLSIDPYCNYGKPETKWEQVAWNRMSNHDMFPEKVDNR